MCKADFQIIIMSWGGSVGKVTGFGLDYMGSIPGGNVIFSFAIMPRRAVGPI
jgi:hypothetical protein